MVISTNFFLHLFVRNYHTFHCSCHRRQKSEDAIRKLEAHRGKKTCPKTLRYNVKALIRPDEESKKEIGTIRKQAEQKLLGALIKFHYRNIDSNQRQLKKKKSERATKPNETNDVNRHETKALSHTNVNVQERFQLIQKQFELMKNMMSDLENSNNKTVASYPCV